MNTLLDMTRHAKKSNVFLLRFWLIEQHFQISPEMPKAFSCDFGAAFCLGQDKGALDHGLGVKPQALGAPGRIRCIAALRQWPITTLVAASHRHRQSVG